MDGPGMEQPAARIRSNRVGLVVAASELGRKADAVSDAPDRWQELRLGQLDFTEWKFPADCLRGYHDDAQNRHRDRRPQTSDHLGNCYSDAWPDDRMHPAECEELDGHELSLLGGAD